MKLYTEEQVIRLVINMSPRYMIKRQIKDIIAEQVTPIELPSDDEAGVIALKIADTLKDKLTTEQEAYFIAGFQTYSKWMKELIINQNK